MRLIDADALIETIKNERFSGWGNCCVEIDDAPTVPAWHVFKNEQPTKEQADYLCISYFDIDMPGFDEKLKWDVSIFRFYDGKFWWFSENEEYEQNDVVFWMEIPEYPMVVKDGKID